MKVRFPLLDQAGQSLEQPGLVEVVPAHAEGLELDDPLQSEPFHDSPPPDKLWTPLKVKMQRRNIHEVRFFGVHTHQGVFTQDFLKPLQKREKISPSCKTRPEHQDYLTLWTFYILLGHKRPGLTNPSHCPPCKTKFSSPRNMKRHDGVARGGACFGAPSIHL